MKSKKNSANADGVNTAYQIFNGLNSEVQNDTSARVNDYQPQFSFYTAMRKFNSVFQSLRV